MASLTVVKGPDRGRQFQLVGDNPTIGRDARNAIRLHDSEISRQHARFERVADGYQIVDLQSSNGTFVNGNRVVQPKPIQTGDCVRVGQTELMFALGASLEHEVDLADRISMIPRDQAPESSAIVRAIKHTEGSQYLRHPERAGSRWLKDALSNLAVMYETSQAISRISDVDQLLVHIMSLVFDHVKPDRGCIVLKDVETNELRPTAVRYADEINRQEVITLSRTIIDWVIKSREGVIILDAAHDERFRASPSVTKIGIREAICVPLAGRQEMLGVMYVDTKTDHRVALETQQPSKFSDDYLKLMIAIGHLAGLAIEDSRLYQSMVQAERLVAIGQTIATLSHHIKNILQGVRTGNDLIEMGLKDQNYEFIRTGWTSVKRNQDRIYHLVLDMLNYSKDREPDLEMGDLNEVATDVADMMRARAIERNVTLETKLDPLLPQTAFDTEGVHRALLNLVTNAIDAVEESPEGKVSIETHADPEGRRVTIAVSDNGCGIPADQQEKVFQVFASTKGSRGTGLGLPVSLKIAREHGGTIRLLSKVGVGSRFTIELPMRSIQTRDMDTRLEQTIVPDLDLLRPRTEKIPLE